jgi:hypothetical protein
VSAEVLSDVKPELLDMGPGSFPRRRLVRRFDIGIPNNRHIARAVLDLPLRHVVVVTGKVDVVVVVGGEVVVVVGGTVVVVVVGGTVVVVVVGGTVVVVVVVGGTVVVVTGGRVVVVGGGKMGNRMGGGVVVVVGGLPTGLPTGLAGGGGVKTGRGGRNEGSPETTSLVEPFTVVLVVGCRKGSATGTVVVGEGAAGGGMSGVMVCGELLDGITPTVWRSLLPV